MNDPKSMPTADTSTDLLLGRCLTRRGLLYEMANLISLTVHALIVEKLMSALRRTPQPGYANVSVDQLYRADIEMFRLRASWSREGIIQKPGGQRPLGELVPKALAADAVHEVLMS